MAGTIVADTIQADSTSTLVLKNGVANTPPTIQDNAGTQIGTFCRAWVNFNGTGTVAIRASFNVTSITDNGTGDYTVNLTTAMPDANYSPVIASQLDQTGGPGNATIGSGIYRTAGALSTGSFRFYAAYSTSGGQAQADMTTLSVAVFR
jgi:hypothetical protein